MPYKQWEYPPPVEGETCVGQVPNNSAEGRNRRRVPPTRTRRQEKIMFATTRILVLCSLYILTAGLLYGQGGANGTIVGTVTDNSGAVVTKAAVDVTNLNTNVTKHTETSSSGDFTVPYLTPGTYRVTVQSQGFLKSVVDKIGLVVGQEARADVVLKPGATTS